MIILDTPSKSIQVYLGQAATNQLNWVASYVDLHQPSYAPQTSQGNTLDTTAVTMISAPSVNAQRQVKYMSVYNADIGSQLVTIALKQSGTSQILVSVNVPTGNTLVYHTERGWELFPYNTINFPITVPQGGTGSTSFSPYALIAAGATSQSPFQQVWPLGNSYQVLTSQGAGALPVWANVTTGTPNGAAGGDLAGNYPTPTVFQAHLTDQAIPTPPSAGTVILQSFNQQGFSVPHIYDTQGNKIEITRDSITVARNNSGVTINKGQVVYVTGATGTVPTVALAQANSSTTMPAVGVMYENTNNNSFGRIMLFGNIENINLSAFSNGDELYVSTTVAGGLTKTRPSFPNFPQFIGTVLNNGVGNGVLFTTVSDVSTLNYGDAAGGDLTGTYPNPTIKSSVNLSGNPTTTTQGAGDNSTKIATTAYVDSAVTVGDHVTWSVFAGAINPVNSTTYYQGIINNGGQVPSTTANQTLGVIPYNCTLIGASIMAFNNTTNGTSEATTVYFRLNNTTDTQLSNTVSFGGTAPITNTYSVTGLSVSCTAGDTFQIKFITPSWVTKPTAIQLTVVLIFVRR